MAEDPHDQTQAMEAEHERTFAEDRPIDEVEQIQIPGVAERLAELRGEALDEVVSARDRVGEANVLLGAAKDRLAAACATALDAGIPADEVAVNAGASSGTVRKWAKDQEGT